MYFVYLNTCLVQNIHVYTILAQTGEGAWPAMVHVYTCVHVHVYTVTAGEDGLATIVTIERATLSTANDIMTVSPHPYTPPLTPVPAADGLLGDSLSDWPSKEQCMRSDERNNTYYTCSLEIESMYME